jgi:glycosyltransferase involved in cell wall biosynthesis
MGENVSISVCMPVYNGQGYLDAAFHSLATQTVENFEVIVVDDGSSDSSYEVAQRLLKEHGLAGVVTRQSNSGCEQARDSACAMARGSLIAPFDCDDQWKPSFLEDMSSILERHPDVGLVYCDFEEEYLESSRIVKKSDASPWIDRNRATRVDDVYVFEEGVFFELLLQGQVLMPPCTMYRRSLYNLVKGYSSGLPFMRISLDWDFGLRASRQAAVAYLDRPLLSKSRHDGNVSGNAARTASCDVLVLEALLREGKLTRDQVRIAKERAAIRAANAGYHEWAINGDTTAGRRWLFKSLRHQWHFRNAMLLAKTLLPPTLARAIRARRQQAEN